MIDENGYDDRWIDMMIDENGYEYVDEWSTLHNAAIDTCDITKKASGMPERAITIPADIAVHQ